VSDADTPRLLLGLTPLAERQVEEQLFAAEQPTAIVGSAPDASELLALSERCHADAVLLAPELPALDAAVCARLRSHGLRLIGLALDEHNARTLDELGVDVTLRPPLAPSALAAACKDEQAQVGTHAPELPRPAADRKPHSPRTGSVLAVVSASGSPGASECAASLAALADQRWPTLLLELDLLEHALALRLGVDPQHGSLLGLVRAQAADGSLRDLLACWTTTGDRGWPPVLVAPPDAHLHIDELARPGAIRAALAAAASIYPLVVADVGALLSFPGELPKVVRVHREALLAADAVLLVIGAREEQLRAGRTQLTLLLDELGIKREQLRIAISGLGAPGAGNKHELQAALNRELAELRLTVDAWLPYDARAAGRARRTGTPLALARPRGRYARAVRALLDQLLLPSQPVPRERKTRLPVPAPVVSTPTPSGDEEVALPWRS
jgi:MinD-like ATPase involved in chromosome partitioning or flagellar assembly